MILGAAALARPDGAGVLAAAHELAHKGDSRFLVLHTAASRVGAMDLGCVTEGGIAAALDADVIYNLGADEIDLPNGAFVIYQGSHGDRGAHRADVILPGAAWTEEPGIFVNTEGRPQMANRAGFPPGEARENWAILRALSAVLGRQLPFELALRAAPADGRGGAASRRDRPGAGERLVGGGAGRARRRRLRGRGRRPLPRQPDHAGERGHGRAVAAGPVAARPGAGGGVAAMEFFSSGFGLFVLILAQCLAVTIVVLVSLAFLMYADRKIWAAVQLRKGPNVVGIHTGG